MRSLCLIASLVLTGCLSTGESDLSSTWTLKAPDRASSVKTKVFLPAELRRPALVTYDQEKITVHDLDRWGAPLQESLARSLASLIADLPIQNVVVNVQRLEVSQTGCLTLLFTAEFTVNSTQGSPLYIESEILPLPSAMTTAAPTRSLTAAWEAYGNVPKCIADRIRTGLAQEQGGVAKPSATVTVPSK